MNPMIARISLAAAVALLAAPSVDAQTLYKLIGKDGKVTYSEKAPKDFDGKVIRIDIDPKANTATLPQGSRLREGGEASKDAAAAREDQLNAARARVDAARKALEDARANPGEADIARMGKKGGGTRPVPTEDYQRRLEQLEREVKEAENGLQKLERER